MQWEYVFVTILFIICMFAQIFYRILYNVCKDMLAGTFIDEDEKVLKLTKEQEPVISHLQAIAYFMSFFALSAIFLNIAFALNIGSEMPEWLKGLTALVNSAIIIGLFQLSRYAITVSSLLQK